MDEQRRDGPRQGDLDRLGRGHDLAGRDVALEHDLILRLVALQRIDQAPRQGEVLAGDAADAHLGGRYLVGALHLNLRVGDAHREPGFSGWADRPAAPGILGATARGGPRGPARRERPAEARARLHSADTGASPAPATLRTGGNLSSEAAQRPPQRRDRGARRPRQDDLGRRDALAVRLISREPDGQRARARLDGSRAREGGSRSSPRTRRSGSATRRSTSSTPPVMRTSAARWERALTMVDGVLLLVDASEGPVAADALRAAESARVAPAGRLVVNKVDRPDARGRRGRRRGLRAVPLSRRDREPDRVPIVYTIARDGRAGLGPSDLGPNLQPLSTPARDDSHRRLTTRIIRFRRWSRTSTRALTSAGSGCCASGTAI